MTSPQPGEKSLLRALEKFHSFDLPLCLWGHGEDGFICHNVSRPLNRPRMDALDADMGGTVDGECECRWALGGCAARTTPWPA